MSLKIRRARAANPVAAVASKVGQDLGANRLRQRRFRFTAPVGGIADIPYSTRERTPYASKMVNFWPTVNGLEPRGGIRVKSAKDGEVDFMLSMPTSTGDVVLHHVAQDSGSKWRVNETEGVRVVDSTEFPANKDVSGGTQVGKVHATLHMGGSTPYAIVVGEGLGTKRGAYVYKNSGGWQFKKFGDANSDFSVNPALSYSGGSLPSNFDYVFGFSSRMFFVKDMEAYYTAAGAGWGNLSRLDLSGVFRRGGKILFGTSWTYDAGDGLNDRCLFFTDRGEVASYVGDPSSTFSLEGVYYVGRPLGPQAHVAVGNDVLFMTEEGLASVRAVVSSQDLGVPVTSVHASDEYRGGVAKVSDSSKWQCAVWPTRSMVVLVHPDETIWMVNLDLNAWARMGVLPDTVSAVCASGGELKFGGKHFGTIMDAWSQGRDLLVRGASPHVQEGGFDCEARMVPSTLSGDTDFKFPSTMTAVWNYDVDVEPHHGLLSEPDADLPRGVEGVGVTQTGRGSRWNVSRWNVSRWSTVDYASGHTSRHTVQEHPRDWSEGDASVVTPYVHLYSDSEVPLDAKFLFMDLFYQEHLPTTTVNEAVGAAS